MASNHQDVRLEEAIGTASDLIGLTVAPLINTDSDTVSKLVKASILEVLTKLGVSTAGIKTESEQIEIEFTK